MAQFASFPLLPLATLFAFPVFKRPIENFNLHVVHQLSKQGHSFSSSVFHSLKNRCVDANGIRLLAGCTTATSWGIPTVRGLPTPTISSAVNIDSGESNYLVVVN